MDINKIKAKLFKKREVQVEVEGETQSRDDEYKFSAEARGKIEALFILGLKKLKYPDQDLIDIQEKYQGFKEETFKKFSEISKEIEEEFQEGQPITIKQKAAITINKGWTKTKGFVTSKLPKKSEP
jgi:hypothetical protein